MAASLVAGVVMRVGAQTGHDLDDVAVHTDADNYALFQVKAGMSLGKAKGSPLGKALEQAVAQYLEGRLRTSDGVERKVDPARDALVLCTDSAAPETVRVHLKRMFARTGSQPPGTPLTQGLTTPQVKALDVVLDHARRLWVANGRTAPDDEQLRGLLRALRVITVDANDGEPDHSSAVEVLSTALPGKGDTARAWPVLVAEGQAASVGQDWRDRAAVGVALSRQGIQLSPPARYAGDIAKLRDLSALNLQTLQSEAVLPVAGGLHISRSVGSRLTADAGEGNVLVVGAAGTGKSAVVQEFATERSRAQEVVVLRAADIAGANRVQLEAPLSTVLRSWTGAPGLVLIDGVDALRGAEDRAFLSDVVTGLCGSRWQIVATARTFDARNNYELQQAFSGSPVSDDPSQVDRRLAGVRHLLVGDLADAELDAAITPPLALASLLAEAPLELRTLLRNPFNLRLAAQLAEHLSGCQHTELLALRSRVGLLEAYWNWRVRNEDSTAREALLARLSREMVSSRSLRVVETEPTVTAIDSPAVRAMLSENVLSSDSGALPAARRVLSFSHNTLFDYAAALYLLHDPVDPSFLLRTLDSDPSLPLVARPSFEILVDLLWEHRDVGAFWPLCLDLAGSQHTLASLAFAARLLNLIRTAEDLTPLAPEPGRTDRLGGFWPAQEFVRQLVGALRTPAVLADPGPVVVPLAALARRLAGNTTASYADAALAADLLIGLQLRAPLSEDGPGTDDRGLAVAALLDGCRAHPQRMEPLAGATARQLPHVIGVSAAVRAAAGRLLDDDDALREWGGTVLTWLADAVVPAISCDPGLARRMAAAVFTFRETRDEPVSFVAGSALLPMSESRRQQAGHGVYRLGQSFARLCAANLQLAAEIFCDLCDNGSERQSSNPWSMSIPGAIGWLQSGGRFSTSAHRPDKTVAAALSAALASSDPVDALPVVAVLVERLHSVTAWTALMTTTGDTAALGRVLLPALKTGALLAHPTTHPAAAGLLAALAEHEPALADKLEATVLRAHALVDANGGSQWMKDALVGCLRPDAITSPVLRARLDSSGEEGSPMTVPQRHATATFGSWSRVDRLSERGVDLEAPVVAIAKVLDEKLTAAMSGTDRSEAERQLPQLFAKADAVFSACESLPTELVMLLVSAAAVLARTRSVLPDTPLGHRVLTVLTTAAGSPDVGSFAQ